MNSVNGAATALQELLSREAPADQTARANIKTRIFGLLIVLSVAFTSFLLASAFYFSGLNVRETEQMLTYGYVNAIGIEIVSLALLLYVLRQNGQKLADIGFGFAWMDVAAGILLRLGAGVLYSIAALLIFRAFQMVIGHWPAPPAIPWLGDGISVWIVIFVLVNPFFEELIVRAFTISEITALTGSRSLAVAVSVGLQTAYHLYQGIPYALATGVMFLVFSLYYVRSRRILPVIIAHLLLDASALIFYPFLKLHI